MSVAKNGNGYGRYSFYATLAIASFTVIGAIIWIGGIANEVAQNKALIDTTEKRLDILSDDLRRNDLDTANMKVNSCQQFAKVETQMGTVETIINTIRVDDLRQRGLMWPKTFSQPYPDTFYEIKIPHEILPC